MSGSIQNLSFMIVAGEPSGDAHASALVEALRSQASGKAVTFFGATGPSLRAAGVEPIVRSDDLAILGLLEIGRALPKFWQAYKTLKQAAIERRPHAVILVDWPDFNFRMAKALHRRGLKIIYYISPQLWAWRPHRVRSIKKNVDLLLTILPFETDWYRARDVRHVEFVGHPLAGEMRPRYDREEFCRLHRLDHSKPIVSLLPGSRPRELQRILPPMIDAASLLSKRQDDVQFVLAIAPARSPEEAKEILAKRSDASLLLRTLRIIHGQTREALAASDAAAVASGTATLEAALLGTPIVIVYKESRINWHTLGRLITTDHYGLVNLIAGERVLTELIQDDLNGQRLAVELADLLDQERNAQIRNRLRQVVGRLGQGGASARAATRILQAL